MLVLAMVFMLIAPTAHAAKNENTKKQSLRDAIENILSDRNNDSGTSDTKKNDPPKETPAPQPTPAAPVVSSATSTPTKPATSTPVVSSSKPTSPTSASSGSLAQTSGTNGFVMSSFVPQSVNDPYAQSNALSASTTQLLLEIAILLGIIGFVCAEGEAVRRFFSWLINPRARVTSA